MSYLKTTFERLITAESLPKLFHDVVLTVGLVLIAWLFRTQLTSLLGRITKNKNPLFGETEFEAVVAKANADATPPTSTNQLATTAARSEPKPPLEYYKSAHFYWLGSDLMEAIRNVAFVPDKEQLTGNLVQVLRHFRKSGLRDNEIESKLTWLIDINRKKLASEWGTETNRRDILNEILIVRSKICQMIDREAGPEFKPWED